DRRRGGGGGGCLGGEPASHRRRGGTKKGRGEGGGERGRIRREEPKKERPTYGRPPPLLGRDRKRSMNDVLSLPATNSGSFRMRRCSGTVVLIPSMTLISSVRFIRAIASCRSRPWTITFAMRES